ncbi:N-acetyl-gamma-glutamyl-phosphate reductase [Aestuariibacter halophilus]|uniref:N-acetyl-gamma-glutamyl-phosphate reductase n=1 Tax=Fluctibacter halophilus TaxID=226011 RepID=A0ABS8GA41_9ALTE|nr:N-acetyl-gamma-glutamyl-phosphate reductase [Aestuariibacter halophilus]MCC2617368.1 N-acetyl-gamma-glutamyl-phosphate reductase [Aestuariibacter halophilus]
MLRCCVVGASGYTGSELVRLLAKHPNFDLSDCFVSAGSQDAHRPITALYPGLQGHVDLTLQPLDDQRLALLAQQFDAIFLATPHEASHDWMPALTAGNARVFDLSGAFRLPDTDVFAQHYGFAHQHRALLDTAVYGLAEWHAPRIADSQLIAVPGCYPTASLLALKPLAEANLLSAEQWPVINAVSGVSGAGRKASLNTSVCEVSLQAYGVLGHRHQPEIAQYLGQPVLFTPHLGNFKRGILATIAVKLASGVTAQQVSDAYQQRYADSPVVRLLDHFPRLDDVVNTPHCDLHWKVDEASGHAVLGSAIDNLLKGAASQAVQCANLAFQLAPTAGLLEVRP